MLQSTDHDAYDVSLLFFIFNDNMMVTKFFIHIISFYSLLLLLFSSPQTLVGVTRIFCLLIHNIGIDCCTIVILWKDAGPCAQYLLSLSLSLSF